MKRVVNVFALAFAVYGFAAWVYVAAVAIILPYTLSWRLTHLLSWPRTDTFGEMSFLASFIGFIVWRFTREVPPARSVEEPPGDSAPRANRHV